MEHLVNRGQPRLSLIIGARNDGYMGNFNWRFETVLNYLGDNLQRLGRLNEVEVVVTDWGSEIPLHTVLSLNSAVRQIIRFILIPPDLAYRIQGESEFPIVIAQNAAVRRSQGEYIAQTDSDILFTPEFLVTLFEILDDRLNIGIPVDQALIVAKRRQIPWEYVSCNPPIHEINWFVRYFGDFLPVDRVEGFGFAATGMMMMHQRLWKECSGYDERLIHWGWMEIDLGLRITHKYPWFDLRSIEFEDLYSDDIKLTHKYSWFDSKNPGLTVFHLEHYHPDSHRMPTRRLNPMNRDNVFHPNGENWGLAGCTLEEFSYSVDTPKRQLTGDKQPTSVRLTSKLLTIIVRVVLFSVWSLLKDITIDCFKILRHHFSYHS